MDASQDLGLGASFMPKILLLIATLTSSCPSCQPNYIILALILSSTVYVGMASRLLQPQSQSTDGDMLMQVCAHLGKELVVLCCLVVSGDRFALCSTVLCHTMPYCAMPCCVILCCAVLQHDWTVACKLWRSVLCSERYAVPAMLRSAMLHCHQHVALRVLCTPAHMLCVGRRRH